MQRGIAGLQAVEDGARPVQIIGMQEIREHHAANLRLGPAEDGLPGRVGFHENPRLIDDAQQIGRHPPGAAVRCLVR